MTLERQTFYAKRFARVDTNYVTDITTDDIAVQYINDGVREFSKAVNGIPKEDYLTLVPRFDTRTNWYIRFTITGGANALTATDVAVTTTNRTDTTGATVASDLQATLRTAIGGGANITVTFNTGTTNTWKFTIDTIDGTAITVAAPTRIDAVDGSDIILGKTGTETGAAITFVSDIPTDMAVETDLPADFVEMEFVQWDRIPLDQAPNDIFISPQLFGQPRWYGIRNDKIRVYPTPNSQKLFQIRYRYRPASLSLLGTDTGTECSLPGNYHMGPVFFAAAQLLEEKHETQKSIYFLGRFAQMPTEYKLHEGNQNPTLFPEGEGSTRTWEVNPTSIVR